MNEPCVSALSAPDRLTAERPLARFGDLQPCDFNRLRAADHTLDGRGGESDTDRRQRRRVAQAASLASTLRQVPAP